MIFDFCQSHVGCRRSNKQLFISKSGWVQCLSGPRKAQLGSKPLVRPTAERIDILIELWTHCGQRNHAWDWQCIPSSCQFLLSYDQLWAASLIGRNAVTWRWALSYVYRFNMETGMCTRPFRPRPRRDRDVGNCVRDETETRRYKLPRRCRDVWWKAVSSPHK